MTWVRWWRCLHSGAYGTCGTALTAVTQRPLNVNALVQTDGHAHVTGRTSGRGYASREYFDWPQVRRIPPHLWWLGFRTWWTQNELQSDANYTQSTDRERTASVPTAWIEVSCVCVCVKSVTEQRHHYYMYIPSVKGAHMFKKSWNTTQNSRRQKEVPIKIGRHLIS